MRTILVHLNVTTALESLTVDDLVAEIRGALEVGSDADNTPALALSNVDVALAEEVAT